MKAVCQDPTALSSGERAGAREVQRGGEVSPVACGRPATPLVLAQQCTPGSGRSLRPWHHNVKAAVSGGTGSESSTVNRLGSQ